MFTYSLVSDLHLDHPQPKTPPMETNVIIAGDCGNGLVGLKYMQKLQRKGHTIFAVTGNHEHYGNVNQGRTVEETEDAFHRGIEQTSLVRQVDERLWLIGANGWYVVEHEPHWQRYMNDSRYCGLSAEQVNELAKKDALFVETALWQIPVDHKAIIVTHTAPCEQSLDPRYEGSDGNAYYWNPFMRRVMRTMAFKIARWHHGHTHASVNVTVDGVNIITNPRGYPSENPSWRPITLTV